MDSKKRKAEDQGSAVKPHINWGKLMWRSIWHGWYEADENGDLQWVYEVIRPQTPERMPRRALFKDDGPYLDE